MSLSAEDASVKEPCLQAAAADQEATNVMNLTLMDPPRWGWAAVGSVADLLPPHERARRKSSRLSFRKQKRRSFAIPDLSRNTALVSTPKAAQPSGLENSGDRVCKPPPLASGEKDDDKFEIRRPGNNMGSGEPFLASGSSSTKDRFEGGGMQESCEGTSSDDKTQSKTVPQHHLKQSPDIASPSLPDLGLPMQFLGLSITTKKRPQTATIDGISEPSLLQKSDIEVMSTKDGVLDMYSYHRGREGLEPRDPESGNLLCDTEQSDTMHGWEAQRTTATIIIEFPLEGGDVVEPLNGRGLKEPTMIARYRDSIQWDLSDATSPAPMTFATNIAEEYGLTSGQTLDLATSIQKQLDAHVANNCAFFDPVSAKDPVGNERHVTYLPRLTHRYGSIFDSDLGGTTLSKAEIAERQQRIGRHGSQKGSAGSNSSSRRRNIFRPPAAVRKTVVYQVDEDEEEIEEKYVNEVRKRAQAASVLYCLEKSDSGVVGPLQKRSDYHCHICHKRCNGCLLFPCGNSSHSYCFSHCKQRLGVTVESGKPPTLDYCPICCVACKCSKCTRKAESIARALKCACEEQGTALEATKLDDILQRCAVNVQPKTHRVVVEEMPQSIDSDFHSPELVSEYIPDSDLKGARRTSGVRNDDRIRPLVPKPPLSEFPREVCGAKELELGTAEDFMTIYTSDGKYVCDSLPEILTDQGGCSTATEEVSGDIEVVEDGNVDYCHVCKHHGNLVCCDFCPRAFHTECTEGDVQPSGEKWECHVCRKESTNTDDDVVDGKDSLDLICAAFFEAEVDVEVLDKMRLLSMIHEMIKKLIDYDFGYMFGQPVEVEKVPGYKELVKNPMDLGTIGSKLINGEYSRIFKVGQSWDELVGAILKDVELVWHNCFTFNYEGSAIYRMADVHRRKAQSIRKRSFDHLLSDEMKAEVDDFVSSCEQARGRYRSSSINSSRRQKGKHKISVARPKGGVTRPVAVLDPSSSRVIMVYSSMKSAWQAAQALSSLGHNCEWNSVNEVQVKAILHRSSEDPSVLLFGHRWLYLDDLRNGKVAFSKSSTDIVEMKHDGKSHVFMSIDEALSSPGLPRATPLDKLRQELASLPRGDDWLEICGRTWRRPRLSSTGTDENKNPEERDSAGDETIRLHRDMHTDQSYMLENSVVAKEDLVSGRRLIGFDSIQTAFDDWVGTCECSPGFPDDESTTIENFRSFYLDGDRNVDGIVWRTTNAPSPVLSTAERPRGYETGNLEDGIAGAEIHSDSPHGDEKGQTGASELIGEGTDSLQRIVQERQIVAPIVNCEDSSLGKRKRASFDTGNGASARHLAKTDCNGSPENPKLQNGTSLKKGQFLEGLHEGTDDIHGPGGAAPNYVSF